MLGPNWIYNWNLTIVSCIFTNCLSILYRYATVQQCTYFGHKSFASLRTETIITTGICSKRMPSIDVVIMHRIKRLVFKSTHISNIKIEWTFVHLFQIRIFWKVFHEQLSTEDKKKFLIFVTASDRFPYGDITKVSNG